MPPSRQPQRHDSIQHTPDARRRKSDGGRQRCKVLRLRSDVIRGSRRRSLGTPNFGATASLHAFLAGEPIGVGRIAPEVLATMPGGHQL